jgi:hypothetical protein
MENSMPRPIGRASSTDAETAWVPVNACTLPTVEQPLRAAEFDGLFAASLQATERPHPQRAHLTLAGDRALLDRVQRLVDAESSCCSFFTFTITPRTSQPAVEPGQTTVELTIEVPEARTDVLEALVTRAEQARQVAS